MLDENFPVLEKYQLSVFISCLELAEKYYRAYFTCSHDLKRADLM